jgi:hypothetical protein
MNLKLELPAAIIVDNVNSAISLLSSQNLSIAILSNIRQVSAEFAEIVGSSAVSDIVVVANSQNLHARISAGLQEAGLTSVASVDKILESILPEIADFKSLCQIDEAEIQFQIRVNNSQSWHTDGGSLGENAPLSQLNYAKTLVGEAGTVFVMDSDIDRNIFLSLLSDLSKEQDPGLYDLWNLLKDQLCDAATSYSVPVGAGFVYKTGRQFGLIHRPPAFASKRLFMKVRPYSELTSVFLDGLGCTTAELDQKGFHVIYNR